MRDSPAIDGQGTVVESMVLIPGGTPHDFENRGTVECGFLCINRPAGFERKMPELVAWFAENPLGGPSES